MALHLDYCASFGLSKQEMEAHPETIGKTYFLHIHWIYANLI